MITAAILAVTVYASDPRESVTKAPADAIGQDQAEPTADAELTHTIRRELMLSPLSIEGKNITIMASHGVVSLKGTVPNLQEKQTIEKAARKFAKDVKSEIVVRQ